MAQYHGVVTETSHQPHNILRHGEEIMSAIAAHHKRIARQTKITPRGATGAQTAAVDRGGAWHADQLMTSATMEEVGEMDTANPLSGCANISTILD